MQSMYRDRVKTLLNVFSISFPEKSLLSVAKSHEPMVWLIQKDRFCEH